MNRILLLFLLAMIAAACSAQAPGSASVDTATARIAAATITSADLHDRIAFLASDELRGRDTPSPGLETAAQWIADELASYGLEAAGEDGWFQRYPYPREALDVPETAFTVAGGATHSFEYGRDFFAWRGAAVPEALGAVYVGAEVVPTERALRERAVIVGPVNARPETGRSGAHLGQDARRSAMMTRERAREAGASAVVFVLDERVTPEEMAALAEASESPDRVLGGVAEADRPLPTFFITPATARRTFRMAGLDPDALIGDTGIGRPLRPLPLPGLTLRLAAPARVTDDRPPNVVGLLRGSHPELRETFVVLSAHMDHTGVGRPDETGDSIYNGADDNASGTSVLVEVAEAMARLDPRPKRSVLFLAVSGEEKGLLGSRWFSDHPTVPLEAMVANVNIDMVGRNAPDSIVVIGQDYSSMGRTVHEVARRHADELALTVSDDLWPEQRFFFRSDHFNFARKEVPALFFFAGTHEDYHRPGDEVEKIDTDKTARVGRLVFYLTLTLAESPRPPEWDPEGLEIVRRLTRQ